MDPVLDAPLRCVPLTLTLTVPDETDAADIAQGVADAIRRLERETERYPARADVVLPALQPGAYELIASGAQVAPGHRLLVLLLLVWARRPWDEQGAESDQVMIDAHQAAVMMCAARWPSVSEPVGMPIGAETVRWAARTGHVVRTRDADEDLVPDVHLL